MKEISEFFHTLRAGVDESGKGDVFGPLVIAGVVISEEDEELLISNKVRDSKMISDNVIKKLAKIIKEKILFDIIIIGPKKYNELYDKMGNINKILGWGHSTIIRNLYNKKHFVNAISDKFSKKNRISVNIPGVELYEFEKGERELSVACASILARNAFLEFMDRLETNYKLTFPKGANHGIDEAIGAFIEKYSYDDLKLVAKVHFKTIKNYGN
ncbi:ribonuclease HIII [bacterium]|nr:ribonuclease HIII [bacterium]